MIYFRSLKRNAPEIISSNTMFDDDLFGVTIDMMNHLFISEQPSVDDRRKTLLTTNAYRIV